MKLPGRDLLTITHTDAPLPLPSTALPLMTLQRFSSTSITSSYNVSYVGETTAASRRRDSPADTKIQCIQHRRDTSQRASNLDDEDRSRAHAQLDGLSASRAE